MLCSVKVQDNVSYTRLAHTQTHTRARTRTHTKLPTSVPLSRTPAGPSAVQLSRDRLHTQSRLTFMRCVLAPTPANVGCSCCSCYCCCCCCYSLLLAVGQRRASLPGMTSLPHHPAGQGTCARALRDCGFDM